MDEILLTLLHELEKIAESHYEIYGTDCRDEMREAVHDGFLDPVPSYALPLRFGLATDEGNALVREALTRYIAAAKVKAESLGLTFKGRLLALQNHLVYTTTGTTSDEFFGYTSPDLFTESGDWLGGE